MTQQDDIIRMAREDFVARGFWPNEVMWACWRDAWLAGTVAERKACADIARDWDRTHTSTNYGRCIAVVIQERSTT